ncbi:hypothetical protein [Pseudomonas sp. RIT-PI-S]|uniref:hypothetical protein n=1 Tax=Pseudomonas sp. RIT-PI-S TaxID=3035295 RepID=UPI0021DB7CEE|nr:hypothetical protein [Pseudomonas sp. RIT-PI-S]
MSNTEGKAARMNAHMKFQAKLIRADGKHDEFIAQRSDVYTLNRELHLWGIQGNPDGQHDLLLLRIPEGTQDGDHPIADEHGVGIKAAFATAEAAGQATSGAVHGLKWDRAANALQASFSFKGALDSSVPTTYQIENGSIRAEWNSPVLALGGDNRVKAAVMPPVFSNAGKFEATEVSFTPVGDEFKLQAHQDINGAGQGVVLFIPGDLSEGSTAQACRAFFIVNQGLYAGRNFSLTDVKWNKAEKTFKAAFAFEFTYGGSTHKVGQGSIALRY